MTSVRLIAAAVLSLMLASPAMAMHRNSYRHGAMHHSYRYGAMYNNYGYGPMYYSYRYGPMYYYPYGDRRDLPVVDALHFGYGQGVCGFHSGYGGLYGDGYYPDNVCSDGGSHLIY